jgi:hypothetical protein
MPETDLGMTEQRILAGMTKKREDQECFPVSPRADLKVINS